MFLKTFHLLFENFIQFVSSKPIPYFILSITSYTSIISHSQPRVCVHYEEGTDWKSHQLQRIAMEVVLRHTVRHRT